MRAAALTLALLLTASGCPQEPTKPTPSKVCHEEDPCWNCRIHGNKKCGPPPTKEDTSDETVLQFHNVGQLQYGTWYVAPDGNSACRWRVEWKPAGDDVKPKLLESGTNEDAVRVRKEEPGKDVFLRFNRACGPFKEAK